MNFLAAVLWGGLAALSLVVGALMALRFALSNRFTGVVMGFGAGALISSIAYELVPDSQLAGSGLPMVITFAIGALTFFLADRAIEQVGGGKRKSIAGGDAGGSGASIFLGTLLDGIPESLILGMGLAAGGAISTAFLVAVFVSNLPEGIAGTRSLRAAGISGGRILGLWSALAIASAAASGGGFALVRALPAADGRYARAFAAGAVLTMLADVMMPEAFEHGGKIVGLMTTMGFLVAAVLSVME